MSVPVRCITSELCIAHAHRWEPERVYVILTAYLDESGTHGGDGTAANPGSAVTVMAGMMGSVRQWARFQQEFDALRHKYGFRIFHAKEFLARSGEFGGWESSKCLALVADLFALTAPGKIMEGVSFRLDNAKFASQFRGTESPKKTALDSAYGLCFRNCALHLASQAQIRLGHHKKWDDTRLHFILESGHRNCGDAVRIFGDLQSDFKAHGIPLLGSLSFADKDECVELVVGDLHATTVWQMENAVRSGKYSEPELFGGNNPGRSNFSHVTHTENGLAQMREKFAELSRRRRWRKRNATPSDPLAVEGI